MCLFPTCSSFSFPCDSLSPPLSSPPTSEIADEFGVRFDAKEAAKKLAAAPVPIPDPTFTSTAVEYADAGHAAAAAVLAAQQAAAAAAAAATLAGGAGVNVSFTPDQSSAYHPHAHNHHGTKSRVITSNVPLPPAGFLINSFPSKGHSVGDGGAALEKGKSIAEIVSCSDQANDGDDGGEHAQNASGAAAATGLTADVPGLDELQVDDDVDYVTDLTPKSSAAAASTRDAAVNLPSTPQSLGRSPPPGVKAAGGGGGGLTSTLKDDPVGVSAGPDGGNDTRGAEDIVGSSDLGTGIGGDTEKDNDSSEDAFRDLTARFEALKRRD